MRKNRQTAKYYIKSYIIAGSLTAGAISMLALAVPVMATVEPCICLGRHRFSQWEMEAGNIWWKVTVLLSGCERCRKYLSGIHCFQNYEIDGTVFDGYYYHDTDGKFKACSPHMEHLKVLQCLGIRQMRKLIRRMPRRQRNLTDITLWTICSARQQHRR